MDGWAAQEFKDIDLGDRRLNKRAMLLAERMAAHPSSSIPQACGGWAETQAAYRFLARDDIEWEAMLAPHWKSAEVRMRAHPVVLCLQDTTELDFKGQGIAGLGPLSYEAQRGMDLHSTYAVTPDREPLGVLDAWMWARQPKDEQGRRDGVLESTRWTEGYSRVAELAAGLPETRLVYVADREADIVALMAHARDLGHPADWLIRSQHNRALPDGGKLWTAVTAGQALGGIGFAMPSRKGQKARSVQQRLWTQRVSIADGSGGQVEVSCLVAREEDAPAGATPVEWRLLTNRPIETLKSAIELIEWYRAMGNRDVLPYPQERLPHRGLAVEHRGPPGTRPGPVHGRGLAHRPTHAPGPYLPRSGCCPAVRAGRVAGGVHPQPQEAAEDPAEAERDRAPGGDARWLPGTQGRWRTRREDCLARPAARHGFRNRNQVLAGGSSAVSYV